MVNSDVYSRIKQDIRESIRSGEWAEGDRVSSEAELVETYGVARHQARQALRDLEMAGWLVRRRGSGTYVAPGCGSAAVVGPGGRNTLALVFPSTSRYALTVSESFVQKAAESGLDTITYNLRLALDAASEIAHLRRVQESGVAGLVAWIENSTPEMRQLLADFHAKYFPFVQVDRYLPGVDADFVVSDNEDLGYRLTKKLVDHGHRAIAFSGLTGRAVTSLQDRQAGYRRALEEAGLAFDESYVTPMPGSDGPPPSRSIANLMARRNRPTAIVCAHDLAASLIYSQLLTLGYSLPKDIELAAVDDQHPETLPGIPVLVIPQCGVRIGRQCVDVLLARMADPGCPAQRRFVRSPESPRLPGRRRRMEQALERA